jgi:hypothetical protein
MTIRLQVNLRSVYGEIKIYPANAAAHYLAQIAGTKTLTHRVLRNAIEMGCEVEVLGRADVIYGAGGERWPSPQSFQLAQ